MQDTTGITLSRRFVVVLLLALAAPLPAALSCSSADDASAAFPDASLFPPRDSALPSRCDGRVCPEGGVSSDASLPPRADGSVDAPSDRVAPADASAEPASPADGTAADSRHDAPGKADTLPPPPNDADPGLDGGLDPSQTLCAKALGNAPIGFDRVVANVAVAPDETAYVVGPFTRAGFASGGAVPIDSTTDEPRPGFPRVAGRVRAIVPDGADGFYLGGDFAVVGGLPRQNLAHVLADGSVDTKWKVDTDGGIYSLALDGTTLYVGGRFSTVGGKNREALAAIDKTGAVTEFSAPLGPAHTDGPEVDSLFVEGGTLYAGGCFALNGPPKRTNLVAFTLADGTMTSWNPGVDISGKSNIYCGNVDTIARYKGGIAIGGRFDRVGGVPRSRIAAFDASGKLTDYAPFTGEELDAISGVRVLLAWGSTLYAGGFFSQVGAAQCTGLAAFDEAGKRTSFNPLLKEAVGTPIPHVLSLAIAGDRLYVGGHFATVGSAPRYNLAAFDAAGNLVGHDVAPDGTIHALAVSGQTVYVGGEQYTMCSVPRNQVAAIDAMGRLTPWAPTRMGYGTDWDAPLLLDGDQLYLAEMELFEERNGYNLRRAARFGAGAYDSFILHLDSEVYARSLAALDGSLFVGLRVSGDPAHQSHRLARYDLSGNALSVDAIDKALITSMAVAGGSLFVGGEQPTDGGASPVLARFASNGQRLPWAPAADGVPVGLAADGDRLYVAGGFTHMGSEARGGLAAFDMAGALLPWAPPPPGDGTYTLITASSGAVFVASKVPTPPQTVAPWEYDVREIDGTGAPTSWKRAFDGELLQLVAHGPYVYAAGAFVLADGVTVAHFARLERSRDSAEPSAPHHLR